MAAIRHIAFRRTATTHEEYLMVSITAQNLFVIDAVLSTRQTFNIFRVYLITPIHAPKMGAL